MTAFCFEKPAVCSVRAFVWVSARNSERLTQPTITTTTSTSKTTTMCMGRFSVDFVRQYNHWDVDAGEHHDISAVAVVIVLHR